MNSSVGGAGASFVSFPYGKQSRRGPPKKTWPSTSKATVESAATTPTMQFLSVRRGAPACGADATIPRRTSPGGRLTLTTGNALVDLCLREALKIELENTSCSSNFAWTTNRHTEWIRVIVGTPAVVAEQSRISPCSRYETGLHLVG